MRATSSAEPWLQPELLYVALAHASLAVVCGLLLLVDAPSVLGTHPAMKPLKFSLSIALFLGTMAIVVPMLQISPALRSVLAWVLCVTMLVEISAIVTQAVRGVPSHFNVATPFDAFVWRTMGAAIVVGMIAAAIVAVVATIRPLVTARGVLDALQATGWRAGLWLFLLAAVSGFAMGGRHRHSVGGEDGGPGLPVLNWSTEHGDLRVPHFVAIHALQVVPIAAALLARLPIATASRWLVLGSVIAGWMYGCIHTLVLAFSGAPLR
ncbi:MAG: hypothetical protein SFX73_13320 [Kofleriaceae bacterium]|nr:hypothetical protein [Kofleriaceae bacterium]